MSLLRQLHSTRRSLLGSAASLWLAACARPRGGGGPWSGGSVAPPLVDAHCHLFNVTDLPVSTFARVVFLGDYEHEGNLRPDELALKEAFDAIEAIVGLGVKTAAHEAADAGLLELAGDEPPLTPDQQQELARQQARAERALAARLALAPLAHCPGQGPMLSVGSIVSWLRSLRSRRARMAGELAAAHTASGYSPRLLCPALVDYGNWLGQSLRSPLPDQVRVAGMISATASLPPVHGYAPFDPLRCALVRDHKAVRDGSFEPLALVRSALTEHGFLGVKLYPPMGFRASGNGVSGDRYPPHVEQAYGSPAAVGQALDRSLDDLWALCEELDAPVMAHAANSNAGGNGFGSRADPTYWFDVAKAHPQLRIMLAHFGRFRNIAGVPGPATCAEVPFEQTWEAAIGRFVKERPNAHLFADVSYLSEIFRPTDKDRAVERMKAYLQYDPEARHIVFGSDWVMLGIEREYPKAGGYASRVASFLTEAGLGPQAVENVMYRNALRFLGLSQSSKARQRILTFYAANGLLGSRLPA